MGCTESFSFCVSAKLGQESGLRSETSSDIGCVSERASSHLSVRSKSQNLGPKPLSSGLQAELAISHGRHRNRGKLSDLVAEHLDHLHYLNDILIIKCEFLNDVLTDHLLNRLFLPLYVYSLENPDKVGL